MSSSVKLLSASCGLSMREAAAFLNLNEHNFQSMWLGRRPCPAGVLKELRELFDKIDKAAAKLAKRIDEEAGAADIELEIAASEKEAEELGLPSISAHEAMFRRTLELLPPALAVRVKVVKQEG